MKLVVRVALVALLGLSVAGAARAEFPPLRRIAPDQALADVALLMRALEEVHPGYARWTTAADRRRARQALEAVARSGPDEGTFYREVARLLATVRCDHTKAEPPDSVDRLRRTRATHLPFRFTWLDGRMIVVSSDPAQPAIPRGSEVTAIDGRLVASLVRAIEPLIAIDGFTDHVKRRKLSDDSDLMGSDLDEFLPYVAGFRDSFRLTLREPAMRAARTRSVAAIPFAAWQALPWSRPYRADFGTSTTWRALDDSTALLVIPTFVNYRRPVEAMPFLDSIFTSIRASGARRLIVDLRDNGGGSDEAAIALMRHVADRPLRLVRDVRLKAVRYGDLERHVQTWGDRTAVFEPPLESFERTSDGWWREREGDSVTEWPPAPAAFAGPVALLAGPRNGSGATMLIARLEDAGRVVVVGEETGGSSEGPTAGQIFDLVLPASGVHARIPVKWSLVDVRRPRRGRGVRPDVAVTPTLASFLRGEDPVLEAARRALGRPGAGARAAN